MANQLMLSNNLGGVGASYATIQDLDNLSLSRGNQPAIINSRLILTGPFSTLAGKTLKYQVTKDSQVNVLQTFTFPASIYNTLDQVVAVIQMNDIVAKNLSGRLSLQTIKYGTEQAIRLDRTGTANAILAFDDLMDTLEMGSGSITNEFTDDDKVYALVMASSEADGYLQRRYTLPLRNWDYKLIEVVCDIAAYKLIYRQGYSPEAGAYDQNFKLRYDKAVQWLSQVGNREIHPVIEANHKPVPNANNGTQTIGDPNFWHLSMGIGRNGRCC